MKIIPIPEKPKGCDDGIIKGMYLFKEFNKKGKTKVQLLGSGTILREIISAAKILSDDYGVTRMFGVLLVLMS